MACRRFARHPRLAHPGLQRAAIRVPRLLDARRTLLLALDPSTPLEGGFQLELCLAGPELFPRQASAGNELRDVESDGRDVRVGTLFVGSMTPLSLHKEFIYEPSGSTVIKCLRC